MKKGRTFAAPKVGGEGGIRTPVPVTRQDAFEAPPLRPLRYLSIYYYARWSLFRFSTSLRARGRLWRLPSGARLRQHFARWSLFTFSTSLRARGRLWRLPSGARLRRHFAQWDAFPSHPRCALAAAFGDSPPALACGGTSLN